MIFYLIWFVTVMKMFKQALIVFWKELKCIVRDKKTFIFGLLLPLFLVPSMLFMIDFSMKGMQGKTAENVNVAMDNKDNSLYDFLNAQDVITVVDVDNPQKALDSGVISAYITVSKDVDEKILKKEAFNLEVKYNESSINSVMSMASVAQYESAYRYLVSNYEFKSVEELRSLMNFKVDLSQVEGVPKIDTSSLYFSMLVPMMLILYCCMGSSGTAAELSAGEKERGTLEPLLSTCADRTGILLGKLFATTLMGITSGLFTVIGLWCYLLLSTSSDLPNISAFGMVSLFVMTVFISMFFSALNLMIGVYAKSYKEAQTYLMPVSLVCIAPTFFTYTLDISRIGLVDLCIPVYNVICIIKEILSGAANAIHVGIVLLWLVAYISILLGITVRIFKKEDVVFRI